MRTDRRIGSVQALNTRQRFFCDSWFNLVHEASLDAFRVRAMNPLNVTQELLRMVDVEHAKEPDIGRVALEACEVLRGASILNDAAFQPVASHFTALLIDMTESKSVKSASEDGGKSAEVARLAGAHLLKSRYLLDAFGRELVFAMERHFVPRSIEWLTTELGVPDGVATFEELEPRLVQVESVLSTLLSTLVNRGWSFPSLFKLYREILLPPDAGAATSPYIFANALRDVFNRLTGEPKPYRITFQINGVSKPTSFPPTVGAIAFSATPPPVSAASSGYVQRYARPFGGRLFATMTVEAQDGRIAGSIASDHHRRRAGCRALRLRAKKRSARKYIFG